MSVSAGGRGDQDQLQMQRQEQYDRELNEAFRNQERVTDIGSQDCPPTYRGHRCATSGRRVESLISVARKQKRL